jgi:RNA polymerase-associated protein RTF1
LKREYARWRADIETHSIKMPMKSSGQRIVNAMTAMTHHDFTSAEITTKVTTQERLKKIATTPNPTLVAKFTKMRDEALSNGDQEEVNRLNEEIRAIKPATLAFGSQLYPTAQAAPTDPNTGERKLTEGEKIAALNARNRKLNTENVRRAQIAERRAKLRAEEAAARGEGEVDSFARIKTRPKTNYDANNPHSSHLTVPGIKDDLFDGSGTDRSRAGTPMSGTDTPKKIMTPRMLPRRTATPLGIAGKNGKKEPIGMIHGPADDDEVIGAMDFELDPEIAGALGL